MKYQFFTNRSALASALLAILGIMAPRADAGVNPNVPWRVLEAYGNGFVWTVFDPAAKPPDFWHKGENLESLARLAPAEFQKWQEALSQQRPRMSVLLERKGDALLAALFDLCSGSDLDSNEVQGVERVGALEQRLFQWTRTSVIKIFDPVARWMGSEIAKHPGKTGDMICWLVGKRDIRLRWPEPIRADEFGPSMSPRKLLSALGSDAEATRVAALKEIAERGGKGAMVAFLMGLQDGEPEVRYGAVLVLEQLAEQRWGAAGSPMAAARTARHMNTGNKGEIR